MLGFKLVLNAFIILSLIYSMPIGLVLLIYLSLTELLVKRWLADLIALNLILFMGLIKLNWQALINQLWMIKKYYIWHGLIGVLTYQLFQVKLAYSNGLFIVLAAPLLIRNIANWQLIHSINLTKQQPIVQTNCGVMVGYSNGNPIILEDKELNQHCLIVGTTGAGKTTTLLNFVASAAQRGLPLIYLDGKGAIDLVNKVQVIANQYDRTLKIFSLRPQKNLPNLAGYNPFASGTATEWKNRIMALFTQAQTKGQEHFSLAEQNYINFVAHVLAKLNKPVDLRVILAFLENPDTLLAVAYKVDVELGRKLAKLHNDADTSKLIGDVIKLLELFIYSDYGGWFNTLNINQVIKIRESIKNKEMVLFLFDASAYPTDTRKVAKMVINDLNSSFAELGSFNPCYCIFDEFASYASDNLAETISLHRSNGMHAIIGTQSITTVKLKASDTKRIAEELIACCNTYIVQMLNHIDDANLLANIMGTRKTYEVTSQINNKSPNLSMVKTINEFKVSPQAIKDLAQGEAIIYRKSARIDPIKIKVNQVT